MQEQKAVKAMAVAMRVEDHEVEPIPRVKSHDERVPGRLTVLSQWNSGKGAAAEGGASGQLSDPQESRIAAAVTKAVTTAIRGEITALREQLTDLQGEVSQLHDTSRSHRRH
jgi:hypothetical protein